MAKFKFRLESLLKVAFNREEKAKKNLAFCLRELTNGQEQLMELSLKQTKALEALIENQQSKIFIDQLINNHQYWQFISSEVKKKQKEVISLKNKVEEARETYYEIKKSCKMLEKLKEKQFINFKLEEEKNFQNELDQIAGNIFYTSAGGF